MTESELRQWGRKEFAYNYLDKADIMVVGRRRSLDILKSFYRYFLRDKRPNNILDLGCGDGILTHELLGIDDSISAMLVDGSDDMIGKAKERLPESKNLRFHSLSFQELLSSDMDMGMFDLAISSLAIHHLTLSEKKSLFNYVFSHLVDGGYFVIIDCVRSPSEETENWFFQVWQERVSERTVGLDAEVDFEEMFRLYTEEEHYSRVDLLSDQMNALREVGFGNVDCYYKHGVFAMFGGKK